jgi:hypothetical protein
MGERSRTPQPAYPTRTAAAVAGRHLRIGVRHRSSDASLEVATVMNPEVSRERSLAEILAEMKVELQEFVQTRIELLRRELN